jgi:hypothetical protein
MHGGARGYYRNSQGQGGRGNRSSGNSGRSKAEALKSRPWGWAPVLMPVIPATQVAEIRRIMVQSQPEQIVHKTLAQKTHDKKGLVEWLKQ